MSPSTRLSSDIQEAPLRSSIDTQENREPLHPRWPRVEDVQFAHFRRRSCFFSELLRMEQAYCVVGLPLFDTSATIQQLLVQIMNYSGLWEKREGRTICRAFAAWGKLSDTEVAGVVAGYAGGGAFIQENFYCQFSAVEPIKLIIDFTDHISGEESSFDDLGSNASELADQALDVLLELHDQDSWEDTEQLLLLSGKCEEMDSVEDDLLKGGVNYPEYLDNLFEYAGLTAKP